MSRDFKKEILRRIVGVQGYRDFIQGLCPGIPGIVSRDCGCPGIPGMFQGFILEIIGVPGKGLQGVEGERSWHTMMI